MVQKKWMIEVIDILKIFEADPECQVFTQPVDFQGLGLKDYLKVIGGKPMDLNTIRKNLTGNINIYRNADVVAEDIRLVFTNCMAYNEEKDPLHKLALKNLKKFDKLFMQLCRDNVHIMDSEYFLVDIKEKVARLMCKLSNANRGKLVAHLEKSKPSAICKSTENSEVLINIDAFTKNDIKEVKKLVLELHQGKKRKIEL